MTEKEFPIGSKVRLASQPPYFKTADPMPMLRPPDTIAVGAEGTIIDRRTGGYWGVRFDKNTLLIDSQYLDLV
jgi:hypothetical protein